MLALQRFFKKKEKSPIYLSQLSHPSDFPHWTTKPSTVKVICFYTLGGFDGGFVDGPSYQRGKSKYAEARSGKSDKEFFKKNIQKS